MQIKKWIATGMSAIMAGATLSVAGLAAADLKNFPTNVAIQTATDSQLDAFIVVGDNANAADIVGAADVAARLAEVQYTVSTVPGATTTEVDGVVKDTVSLTGQLDAVIPDPVKNIHFSGLKDTSFTWRSTSYDFSEQVSLENINMDNDFGTDKINGTETMVVESGEPIYKFIFDQTLTGTGSNTNLNYTFPVPIELLGSKFQIIGAGSNEVVMLTGSTGTVIKEGTSITPIAYGVYTVEVTAAANNDWASFVVKDANGAIVDTVSGTTEGNVGTASNSGLDIRVIDVRVSGTDPATQHIEVDVVVGPTGATQKTYTTSCDVTSTGTADKKFPGTTDWCIQVSGFATAGSLSSGDEIQVVRKPGQTTYFKEGEKITLPNDYAEIGFLGFNTDNFATITVEPSDIGTVYYNNRSTILTTDTRGFKISSDVAGSILDPKDGTGYTEAYVIFNKTLATSGANTRPVLIGFKHPTDGKIFVPINDPPTAHHANYSARLNDTAINTTTGYFDFTFNISVGGASSVADQVLLFVNVTAVQSDIVQIRFGREDDATLDADVNPITVDFQNKTAWESTSSAPEFRLGSNTDAQAGDITAVTGVDGGTDSIGNAQQDVLTNLGVFVLNTAGNSGAQRVKVKVPAEALKVKAYVGKAGAVTGGDQTFNKISPVKTAVARLASEVGTSPTKNVILVGGSCANSLVQSLVDAGKIPAEFSCAGGVVGSGWVPGSAWIWAIEDAFTTGKIAIVAAGTNAADTRLATSVLQNYDHANVKGKLTGTAVKVSGTDVSTATIEAA